MACFGIKNMTKIQLSDFANGLMAEPGCVLEVYTITNPDGTMKDKGGGMGFIQFKFQTYVARWKAQADLGLRRFGLPLPRVTRGGVAPAAAWAAHSRSLVQRSENASLRSTIWRKRP